MKTEYEELLNEIQTFMDSNSDGLKFIVKIIYHPNTYVHVRFNFSSSIYICYAIDIFQNNYYIRRANKTKKLSDLDDRVFRNMYKTKLQLLSALLRLSRQKF